MNSKTPYDYRQFQNELAALDRNAKKPSSAPSAAPSEDLYHRARTEFLALKTRFGLTIADVVAFFPEEEGIAYLQGLIAAAEASARRT